MEIEKIGFRTNERYHLDNLHLVLKISAKDGRNPRLSSLVAVIEETLQKILTRLNEVYQVQFHKMSPIIRDQVQICYSL